MNRAEHCARALQLTTLSLCVLAACGGPRQPAGGGEPLTPPATAAVSALAGRWIVTGYRQSSAWTEGVVLSLEADGHVSRGAARTFEAEPAITDVAFCGGACGGAAECTPRCSIADSWSAASPDELIFDARCSDGRARRVTFDISRRDADDGRETATARLARVGDQPRSAGWCTIVHVGLNYLSLRRCEEGDDCAALLSQSTQLP